MKLRRAMAVAAATAVIAPAAFLAAPAAHATDGATGTASTSGTTGETDTTPGEETEPEDDTTPGDDTTPVEETEPEDDDTTPGDETKPEDDDTTPGDETKPKDDDTTPGDETKPKDDDTTPGDETKPEDDEDGEEEEDWCEETTIDVSLSGFPNKIVAGSGWKQFKLNVTNTGETDIEELQAFAFASYEDDYAADYNKLVEKYAHFEMKDPDSGKWNHDFVPKGYNNGAFEGFFALDAGQSVTIDLRVKIDKGAPAGSAFAIVAGGDTNEGEDAAECAFDADEYPLQVIAAGGDAGDVEDSKPTGEKPDTDLKPQGEAKEIPVTGNLAETGSSSVLPTVGIAGGIAIVAGAGVVFAMKRRKSDAVA